MAEARSAVGKLRVFPGNLLCYATISMKYITMQFFIDLEEGRDSWKDVYTAIRKSLVRRFFRTR